MTKLDSSDKDTKNADAAFDPLKTELPVKDIIGEAMKRECYKLHDDDLICHNWNHEVEKYGGPKIVHFNIKN